VTGLKALSIIEPASTVISGNIGDAIRMADNAHIGHRERLRQRFLEDDALDEETILELLLCYAIPQRDVRPLAHDLIASYGSLDALLNTDPNDLCHFPGVKQATAALVHLVWWIRDNVPTVRQQEATNEDPEVTGDYQGELVFESEDSSSEVRSEPTTVSVTQKKTRSRTGLKLYAKAFLAETVELLSKFPETESLSELRRYLRANLPFSAEETRVRNSNYILRRLFPLGYADIELQRFAKAFAGQQALRDVCFYRFCKVESLMCLLIEEVITPAIGSGSLSRSSLSDFLSQRFPNSKSIKECVKATVDALVAVKTAKADKSRISVTLRDVPIPSLAFIIHSEYPTPGMYGISELETNEAIRSMLWRTDQLLPALYEMRNLGLITKVSEIDSVRQFTTRYTLAQVVEQLMQVTMP